MNSLDFDPDAAPLVTAPTLFLMKSFVGYLSGHTGYGPPPTSFSEYLGDEAAKAAAKAMVPI